MNDNDLRELAELREMIARQEGRLETLASKEWVRELVDPIKNAAQETQRATTSLSEQFKALFVAHGDLLKERAAREREEHEQKSWTYIIKNRWMPALELLAKIITICAALGAGLTWWILNYVFPHAK